MDFLEAVLSPVFERIDRKNWKRAVAFVVVVLVAAGAFLYWASLPQK